MRPKEFDVRIPSGRCTYRCMYFHRRYWAEWSNGCIAGPTTLIPRNKEIEVG